MNALHELHPALLLLKRIPKGMVVTYKELARAAGTSPRAVGQILKRNPRTDICPCYKVIRSDGTLGGYAGETKGTNIEKKIMLLAQDGVIVKDGRIDARYLWSFP